MSGGSYDYFFYKLEDIANQILVRLSDKQGEAKYLRLALVEHIKLLATALQVIEYVDSGDYSEGLEIEPIKKVLNHNPSELDQVIIQAEIIKSELDEAISRIRR